MGLALLVKELLPALRTARGRIINISSVLGYTGMPLASLYVGRKHAVEGFSEALAFELGPRGVQVAIELLLTWGLFLDLPRIRLVWSSWATFICVSTMAAKQHFAIDVLLGGGGREWAVGGRSNRPWGAHLTAGEVAVGERSNRH